MRAVGVCLAPLFAVSAFDPVTTAWVNAVIANGGTVSPTRETLVDNLIKGLKTDGLFTKLDRLWLFAGENTPQALTDIVADSLATAVNSPTFTISRGYTGNGSNMYIDSNVNPSTAPGLNYVQNAADIVAWNNTAGADASGFLPIMGLSNSFTILIPKASDNNLYVSVNNNAANDIVAGSGTTGSYIVSRTSSVQLDAYVNGTNVISSGSDTSAAIANDNFNFLRDPPAVLGYSSRQISCGGFGGGFSSTNVTNLHNRLCDFMGGAFADAWARQVVTNGGTVSAARQSLVANLIAGGMRDGWWYKMDRLWLFANENSTAALTDIVAGSLATAVNSPTFTTDRGFTGDGSTTSIDSNFNPFTAVSPNFTQNSASFFAWNNTSGQSSTPWLAGDNEATGVNAIAPHFTDGNDYTNINGTGTSTATPNSVDLGLFLLNRTSSSGYVLDVNGSQTQSITQTSGGVTNSDFLALRSSSIGTVGNRQCSCFGFGGGLSSTNATNLYNRLCDFMGGAFADAWAKQVVTNGGTVSAGRQSLVANLIAGGMRDGWWYKMDRLWLFANENSTAALTDVVADALATAHGSPTFTTDRGFTGVDASSTVYIDTGFNASTAGGNYAQSSAHLSAWSNTSGSSSASGGNMIGVINSNTPEYENMTIAYSDGNSYAAINQPANVHYHDVTGTGHYLAVRDPAGSESIYNNGTSQGQIFNGGNALLNGNFYVMSVNDLFVGGSSGGTGRQHCMASIGGFLSSTDVTNFYNRLRTYMTAVGLP